MEHGINDIDDLIGKVLAGEASNEETLRLTNWINSAEDNRIYYNQIKKIFDTASARQVQLNFDEDAAWRKMKGKLKKSENKVVPFMHYSKNIVALRIAAGLALLVGLSIFAYLKLDSPSETFSFTTRVEVAQDTLPDGSVAFLNKKSSISYEYINSKKIRKVKLKGEGFFDIKHEDEKPFVIETDELLIRDIGTSFNVKAYPESDTIVVTVKTGEVQLYTLTDDGLNLKQGETGVYNRRSKEFSKLIKADTNLLSYKTGVFSFNSTNLRSVIKKINEVYESNIQLESPSLDKCPITVNFHEDSLETIIEVIAETLNLSVVKENEKIILKGKGCDK